MLACPALPQANNAGLERVMLLWERGEQHRAITELQQVRGVAPGTGLALVALYEPWEGTVGQRERRALQVRALSPVPDPAQ